MVFTLETKGNTDIIDITDDVQGAVEKEKVKSGVAVVFVKGSTAAVTTIEADENLFEDLRGLLDSIAPMKKDWKHHKTWGDDNGAAHLRAAIIGPSISVPIVEGKLVLGSWQKIVLIDFDTSSRTRELFIHCLK